MASEQIDTTIPLKKERRSKKDKKARREKRRSHKQTQEPVPPTTQPEERVNHRKKRSRSSSGMEKDRKSSKKLKQGDTVPEMPVTPSTSLFSNNYLSNDKAAITKFREAHGITVHGDITNFLPIETFNNARFPPDLESYTAKFSKPTPIQAQTWPILLSARDVIGIAETGSGKTLAFGLPGLAHVKKCRENYNSPSKPVFLVLAPTRELAQQSHDVLAEVGQRCNPKIRTVVIYGGIPKDTQRRALSNVDVVSLSRKIIGSL